MTKNTHSLAQSQTKEWMSAEIPRGDAIVAANQMPGPVMEPST